MSTITRVAAWQCQPGPLDVAGNLRRLDEICAAAAARQVEVLVTPEMFTSGYGLAADQVAKLAENPGGPTETAVAQIARRHRLAIVFGHPERADGDGDPATVRTTRRRWSAPTASSAVGTARCTCSATWTGPCSPPAPSRPAAFDFDGSRAGLLICYDVEFPEAVRRLAVDGARTVLVPTANMAGYEVVQQFLVRARACENGCGLVYANYCGGGRPVRVQRPQRDLRTRRRGARPGQRGGRGTDRRRPPGRIGRDLPRRPPGRPVRRLKASS